MKALQGNISLISVPWFPFHVDLSAANAYTADGILRSSLNIPLRGVAIGNGWIDGRNQYPSYLEYAATHGIIAVESQVHMNSLLLRPGIWQQNTWKRYRDIKQATDQCLTHFHDIASEPINIDECEKIIPSIIDSKLRM